jgi:hypothetical protein
MIELLDKKTIASCKDRGPWTLGNEILYKMCADNFTHDSDEEIIAKVWLIGRSYAAAVERRKNKNPDEESDNFYTKTVVDTFRTSHLDQSLTEIKTYSVFDTKTLQKTIETHHYLTNLLNKITDLNKRSFSAKYLHFHIPNFFFIYDSRAAKGINSFKIKIPRDLISYSIKGDIVYADFVMKCFVLMEKIRDEYNIQLTPRQLDNLLLKRALQ